MPCGFFGDTGTRVTTNRTQWPSFRVHHENLPVEVARVTSRVESRGSVTAYSYHTEATKATESGFPALRCGDGGWAIVFLGENAFATVRPLGADGKKSEADQPLTRAGSRRLSLAVQLPPSGIGPNEPMDGTNGVDFVAFFRKTSSQSLAAIL